MSLMANLPWKAMTVLDLNTCLGILGKHLSYYLTPKGRVIVPGVELLGLLLQAVGLQGGEAPQ